MNKCYRSLSLLSQWRPNVLHCYKLLKNFQQSEVIVLLNQLMSLIRVQSMSPKVMLDNNEVKFYEIVSYIALLVFFKFEQHT